MIKFMHVRAIDEDGRILPHGGVTIAYQISEELGVLNAAWTKCQDDTLFCYKEGRENAIRELRDSQQEQFEVLDIEHPITHTLADWLANSVWVEGPESWGMGFAIDLEYDADRGRWVSTFQPSQFNASNFLLYQPTVEDPDYASG